MKKIIAGFFAGVAFAAVGAWAAPRLLFSDNSPLSAATGTITCSNGSTQLFSDTIPAGYTFSGNVAYTGSLTVAP